MASDSFLQYYWHFYHFFIYIFHLSFIESAICKYKGNEWRKLSTFNPLKSLRKDIHQHERKTAKPMLENQSNLKPELQKHSFKNDLLLKQKTNLK